jgi:hypothetical protein
VDLDTVEAKEHGVDRSPAGDIGHRDRSTWALGTAWWKAVGIALLVVVAIGSVILVVTFDPAKLDVNTLDPTLSTTSRHGAAGFAIALGVFLIALVTAVPYFALSRLRYRLAGSGPAEQPQISRVEPAELDAIAD